MSRSAARRIGRAAVPVLAGLGVHELSVSPAAVPRVKAVVRQLDVGRCSVVAGQAMELDDADHVRKLVLEAFGEGQGSRSGSGQA